MRLHGGAAVPGHTWTIAGARVQQQRRNFATGLCPQCAVNPCYCFAVPAATDLEIVPSRLHGLNADRQRMLTDVRQRVMRRLTEEAVADPERSWEYVLNEVCYHELGRLAGTESKEHKKWQKLAFRIHQMSDPERRRAVEELVDDLCQDVVGNFDERVYKFTTTILPPAFGFLFSPIASVRQGVAAMSELDARITVEGELDLIRKVARNGTIAVAPTHLSNMDSPVIGLALLRAGLPPVAYGAGKNLFTNPFISFFMRNLGAYRVDRRLKYGLYKLVLKEYSTVLLENGYHSLFFPGGTRCRSGVVERHLKLGLLGTTVGAAKQRARVGNHQRMYIVPATINYRLVLEAETLIEDFLADDGKSRYIITDDEFSRATRLIEFARKIFALEGAVVVRFGRPLDPLGNDINDDGESVDQRGVVIDPVDYLRDASGAIADDDQRDTEYTRLLGARLAAAYPALTVFHSTHLVARAVFDELAAQFETRDIYKLSRLPAAHLVVARGSVVRRTEMLLDRLREPSGEGRLHSTLVTANAASVVQDALRALSTYHTKPVLRQQGDVIVAEDIKLIYYYQNRTAHMSASSERGVK